MSRFRTRGFTLIEMLIALAILGLLGVLGYRAMAALTESEARLAAEAARWRTLDQLFARIEADARTAVPRPMRDGTLVLPAWTGTTDAGGNAQLVFARAGSEFALEPGSGGQRIGYRLANGTIEVLYWPYFDQPPATTPASYALAADIAAFRVAYLDEQGRWLERWPLSGDTAVPRALRVEVQLVTGGTLERWLVLQ